MRSPLPACGGLAAFVLLGLAPSSLQAQQTRLVPEQYSTIQAAIDASVHGDVVSVAPGQYVASLTFAGKNLTVRSRHGAASTVLDARRNGSIVRIQNGESSAAILEGFTLRGGSNDRGGAVLILGASPTIRCCILHDNRAFEGGAIYFERSSARVENCFLYGNLALRRLGGMGGMGGAMYADSSSLTLQHVTVSRNDAANAIGHGLFVASGTALVQSSIFHTGASIHYGSAAQPTVDRCILNGPWLGAGSGNLWTDPGFVDPGIDPANPDLHLRHDSPARDGALALNLTSPVDVELDTRASGAPDIGADEFQRSSHWYVGNAVSFGEIVFRANGMPGDLVFWGLSAGVVPAPMPTIWGPLWLDATMLAFPMGVAPASGVVEFRAPLPWMRRTTFYSQVLVGPDAPRFAFSDARRVLLGGM